MTDSTQTLNDLKMTDSRKRPADPDDRTTNKGWKLLKTMGYKEGEGLGLKQTGITEPVELKAQSSRLGLGAELIVPSDEVREDDIEIEEEPTYFPPCSLGFPTESELENAICTGKMPTVMDKETMFCSEKVLLAMLSAKNVFDNISDRALFNARSRANPFESIRSGIFQNRAAMKMANLDAVFDFQLTMPKDKSGNYVTSNKLDSDDLFYFVDICAGPGGFTEYILWKRTWTAKGFGMTLRGKDDFRLDKFLAASPHMFEPYYGTEEDGDITRKGNLTSFRQMVMDGTAGKGVHLVMADGGFSVKGNDNIQEVLSKRLYLCQSLCALNVLCEGGNFVCKLFDTFTLFSVGLLNLLWRCFDRMTIHKPHSSRPANSERYLVGLGFKGDCEVVKQHLVRVNETFASFKRSSAVAMAEWDDVLKLLPDDVLLADESFVQHLRTINEQMALRQTRYLKMYEEFAKNPMYTDDRQAAFRQKCLQYWAIPDAPRQVPNWTKRINADSLISNYEMKDVVSHPLTLSSANDLLGEVDWSDRYVQFICMTIGGDSDMRWMASLGRRETFVLQSNIWCRFHESNTIIENSILLVNITNRRPCVAPHRRDRTVIRILDVLVLGGVRLTHMSLAKRLKVARTYCRAVNKYRDRSKCSLETAPLWPAKKAADFLANVDECKVSVHNTWKLKVQEYVPKRYFYGGTKLVILSGVDKETPLEQSEEGRDEDGFVKISPDICPIYQSQCVTLPKDMDIASDDMKNFCLSIVRSLAPENKVFEPSERLYNLVKKHILATGRQRDVDFFLRKKKTFTQRSLTASGTSLSESTSSLSQVSLNEEMAIGRQSGGADQEDLRNLSVAQLRSVAEQRRRTIAENYGVINEKHQQLSSLLQINDVDAGVKRRLREVQERLAVEESQCRYLVKLKDELANYTYCYQSLIHQLEQANAKIEAKQAQVESSEKSVEELSRLLARLKLQKVLLGKKVEISLLENEIRELTVPIDQELLAGERKIEDLVEKPLVRPQAAVEPFKIEPRICVEEEQLQIDEKQANILSDYIKSEGFKEALSAVEEILNEEEADTAPITKGSSVASAAGAEEAPGDKVASIDVRLRRGAHLQSAGQSPPPDLIPASDKCKFLSDNHLNVSADSEARDKELSDGNNEFSKIETDKMHLRNDTLRAAKRRSWAEHHVSAHNSTNDETEHIRLLLCRELKKGKTSVNLSWILNHLNSAGDSEESCDGTQAGLLNSQASNSCLRPDEEKLTDNIDEKELADAFCKVNAAQPSGILHRHVAKAEGAKLKKSVHFDPLALLLDASLEGELDLVKKCSSQVANVSVCYEEGITALHNAICAGHYEVFKFLIDAGADVNAQDSDGWTPLHCAASCNNLPMAKFLVEHGACVLATTMSDQETPADKCEESEEGFVGCSQFLLGLQERMGVVNGGKVYGGCHFDARRGDEISFRTGDELKILTKDTGEEGWWWAVNLATGQEGYAPRNLLAMYPRQESA